MDELIFTGPNIPVLFTPTGPSLLENTIPNLVTLYYAKHNDLTKMWATIPSGGEIILDKATYLMYKQGQGIKKIPVIEATQDAV